MATREQYDRDAPEAEIASKLSERFAELRQMIERGEAVDWPAWEARMKKELEDELAAVFIILFLMMRDDSSRGSQLAQRFATTRAGELVSTMRRNFRNEINSGVPVQDIFDARRAATIAITEVTTAITQAEIAARREAVTDDPQARVTPDDPAEPPIVISDGLVAIWQTAEDERVCPVCGPLHDARDARWASKFPNGPPAHPRCRCWLIYENRR